MRLSTTLILASLAFSLTAAPAFADRDDHRDDRHRSWKHDEGRRDWHERGPYWRHGHHYPYVTVRTISTRPRPVVYYYPAPQVVYQNPPQVQQIVFNENAEMYRGESGQYCREYTTLVYVGGSKQNAYGTACLQEDGSWRIVK